MKVGFHSPLPPARTGVADYSAALLEALRQFGSVEPGAERADASLYHLGNNQLHRAIYERALARPGVIVLHDAVLQHFFLGSTGERGYVDEFIYNYGEWSRQMAEDLYRRRAASAGDPRYFAYPMLRRIVERSRAAIVHNPGAAAVVRRHVPSAAVYEIPHLFARPELPAPSEAIRFRQGLKIPACAFIFGVFGYLRESKRLLSILRAFRAAAPEHAWLLVAGDFVSSDLERAAGPWLEHPRVRRLPYLRERDFWLAASASDACINLRHPAAGETSGIAIRLMGIGKATMVTDCAETSAFPDGAAVRIDAGIAEQDALRDNIVLFTSFRPVASEIGRRGADHISARHSVGRIAELYWKVLCEHDG